MVLRQDPERMELNLVEKHAPFKGKEVLEIGCGNGRLTFQYAASASKVIAIDPSPRAIAEARKMTPSKLRSRIVFKAERGEDLRFPDESSDVVFFSWSLCCTDIPAMGKALQQAWRVLRQDGFLVNIQPSLHQPFRMGMISYILRRNSGSQVTDEGEREARLALRHSSFVEGKFRFLEEEEFPVFSYYDNTAEALRNVTAQSGVKFRELDRLGKQRIRALLKSMRTRKGVRVQENAVLTILRKAS